MLPIKKPRIRRMALGDLVDNDIPSEETVIVPPAAPARPNHAVRKRLADLDQAGRAAHPRWRESC